MTIEKCVIKYCNNDRYSDCCYGMCGKHCSEKKHHYLENGKMKYPNIREQSKGSLIEDKEKQ